ncbi:hypothetical protein [Pseudomonas prosekii]|uniref:hypothetical protein n=1 Tax=Pseudomonas prosekii TaxID=1148509 RepID=UPI00387B58F5
MSEASAVEFNELVSKILDLAVTGCPVSVEITTETFELPKGDYEKSQPTGIFGALGFYNATPEEVLLNSTLQWLVAEGFLRTGEDNFYVATLQTLKLRGAVPNTLSA